jgi:L-serine/L-threonine ammonia-lyase
MEDELPRGLKPDAIVCAVGGGGLFGGIALGAEDVGWEDGARFPATQYTNIPDGPSLVPIIGVETHGSACFYHSVQATRGDESQLPLGTAVKEVRMPDALQAYSVRRSTRQDEAIEGRAVRVAHLKSLSSRATSLGASSPSASVVQMAVHRKGGVRCITVSDERAMDAALRFAGTWHHSWLSSLQT